MSVSTRLRFDILKRDGFQCQYCGAEAPWVELQVDHVRPVSAGGGDVPSNLITSCLSCNHGKTNVPLSDAPKVVAEMKRLTEDQFWEARAKVRERRESFTYVSYPELMDIIHYARNQ